MRLYFLTAASIMRLTLVDEETSVLMKNAKPPCLLMSEAVFFPSLERVAMTTTAPSRAKSSAMALPMPEPAPVIMAVFPRSCITESLLLMHKKLYSRSILQMSTLISP